MEKLLRYIEGNKNIENFIILKQTYHLPGLSFVNWKIGLDFSGLLDSNQAPLDNWFLYRIVRKRWMIF